ncbi:hypothetical protein GCM10009754_65780 [Amycolatopsis minnesotensis]|uniref:Translation initiation factor 2 n=2 Tax=Amycolatopsis minnesotensis TaxID=337894 RepID=A0ABN2S4F0_9PSEU
MPALAADPGSMPWLAASPGQGSMTGPADRMPPPPSYGLLSGADASSLERERAALDAETTGPVRQEAAPAQQRAAVRRPLAAHWILLVAVLLGLAAGSIIGLLTLV